MKVICTRCGSTRVTCEAWINPNEKEMKEAFDHFCDESFNYGTCEHCKDNVKLTDSDDLKNEIQDLYLKYRKTYNKEPQLARCEITYCDQENDTIETWIKLSQDAHPDDDDEYFHYCNGISGLKSLCDKGSECFVVTWLLELACID